MASLVATEAAKSPSAELVHVRAVANYIAYRFEKGLGLAITPAAGASGGVGGGSGSSSSVGGGSSNSCPAVTAHTSVELLLDCFNRAAAEANLVEYFGCFAQNGRFLGTDATENWSVDEFYAYSKPHFDIGKGWTYVPRLASRNINIQYGPDGSPLFASFDELLDSPSFKATCRGSGTAVYSPSSKSWLVFSYHLTFPTPNDIAKKLCLEIAAFEKEANNKVKAADASKNEEELLAMLDKEKKKNKDKNKNKGKGKSER